MERRKSLIALPLNPSPGCYNLPSSLLSPPLPIVNPSPPPPLFSRVLQAAFPLASCVPPLLHTDSSAALQLSAVPPSLLRLTKKHCTSARQKPHNLEPFDRVSKPTSLLNKLKVCWGGGEVYFGGLCQRKSCPNPSRITSDRSARPEMETATECLFFFSKWAFN